MNRRGGGRFIFELFCLATATKEIVFFRFYQDNELATKAITERSRSWLKKKAFSLSPLTSIDWSIG